MRHSLFGLPIWTAVMLVALCYCSDALTDPEECQDAINKYNTAVGDVSDALGSYARCVSDSRGHDDCSIPFSTLQSAHSDFEDAVSAYGSDCQ